MGRYTNPASFTFYLFTCRVWTERQSALRRGKLTSDSAACRQNNKILSETLLRCTWSRHTLNAEHSRPLIFWLLWTSWEGRSQGCRVDTVPTTTTDADVRCCRRRIDNQVTLFLWYRCRYCTTTRYRQLQPVADLTAPRTSRHRRSVADSEAQSTRRRLHSVADLPAPTTCRRLRHINGATVSWRHVATRRSVRYCVDTCLPSTTTILCTPDTGTAS